VAAIVADGSLGFASTLLGEEARQTRSCPQGRYRFVVGAAPTPGLVSSHGEIVVSGSTAAIPGVCDETAATLRSEAAGTLVSAQWKGCKGLAETVRMDATIRSFDCAILGGTFTIGGAKRMSFSAALEDCKDLDAVREASREAVKDTPDPGGNLDIVALKVQACLGCRLLGLPPPTSTK
jgi:hypothetical protein